MEANATSLTGEKANSYDDPYLMLAYYIVSHYSLTDIKRSIYEDEWLKARVIEDCYNLDLGGPFIDTVMQEIDERARLWLRPHLKTLGEAFWERLDLKRLRKNILQILVLS